MTTPRQIIGQGNTENAQLGYELLMESLGIGPYDLIVNACSNTENSCVLAIIIKDENLRCGVCHSSNVKKHTITPYSRILAHLQRGEKKLSLKLYTRRVYCFVCKKHRNADAPGIPPRLHQSDDLIASQMADYSARVTFANIAYATGVSQSTTARRIKARIKEIDEAKAKKLPRSVRIDDNYHIGNDGKPWTALWDGDTGQLIFAIPGKSVAEISKELRKYSVYEDVEEYACDGAAEYIEIGHIFFPNANRALDRWHAIDGLQEMFSEARLSAKRKRKESKKLAGNKHNGNISQGGHE
jgi:transposase